MKLSLHVHKLAIPIVVLSLMSIASVWLVSRQTNKTRNNCVSLASESKPPCWKKEFESILKSSGVDKGFELLAFLYSTDQEFAGSCHDYTHLIGEEAYRKFSKNENFKITNTSSYCGYGFYHGFIIALFKDGEGGDVAANFCRYANDMISRNTQTAGLDCFHGIGHGATDFVVSQTTTSESLQTVVDNGLKLCQEVGANLEQKNRCVDGVYHSILDTSMVNPKHFELVVGDDVFKFCKSQKKIYQTSCYQSMGFLLMSLNDNDFSKTLHLIQTSLEPEFAGSLVRQMSGYEAYRSVNTSAISTDILVCQKLKKELKEECIRGLIEGLTDFGTPDKEELAIVNFCNDNNFNNYERDFCFLHGLEYFKVYFGEDKRQLLCQLTNYKYCSYELTP